MKHRPLGSTFQRWSHRFLGGQEALDRLEIGVILVCDRGRVMAANRVASEMAAAGDGFSLSREGPVAERPMTPIAYAS